METIKDILIYVAAGSVACLALGALFTEIGKHIKGKDIFDWLGAFFTSIGKILKSIKNLGNGKK